MNTLGGNVCIRNGDSQDYCWREAVRSLLPVCDKVIICDCDSTDGTRQAIDLWAAQDPKIVVANFPWTNPKGDPLWWVTFLNYARQHLPTTMHIQLDADEILHENSYDEVTRAKENGSVLYCKRFNFWKDAQHLIPEGHCCSAKVIRVAPCNMNIPSDSPWPEAQDAMNNAKDSGIEIMHYGFIREVKGFFKKARSVQSIWANSFDPRLERAEQYGLEWASAPGLSDWQNQLVEFKGTHPAVIHEWLKERGHHL